MEVEMKAELDLSVQRLVTPRPVIAGNVRTLMSSCGKPGCKCMKKTNPEKHPYHQLSYTHNKKTKTMYVKRNDFAAITKMADNYKDLRQASLDLGHEAVGLIKIHGVEAAGKIIMNSFDHARREAVGARAESSVLRKARCSQAVWKNKAISRQVILEKNRIKIRDMTASRQQWKNKAVKARKELKKLQKKLGDADKNISEMKKERQQKKKLQRKQKAI
jgi:hypothetical protein